MKVLVEVTHSYGSHGICYSKMIEMPAAPFYDMSLFEYDVQYENKVDFVNDDYTRTIIFFDMRKNLFEVSVRKNWKHPVTKETLDSLIKRFSYFEWTRWDNTNIEYLKQLMRKHYEDSKK
jgi:hypothetical protein